MPIIVPFLVGAARVAGPLAVKEISKRLAKRAAKQGVAKGAPKPGFRGQPKVEGLPQAVTRQKLRRSRRQSTREFKKRMEVEETFRRESDAALREARRFEDEMNKVLGDLVKGLRKEDLRRTIITGRGRPSKATRDFNKAITRETLRLIRGGGGGGF